MPSLAYMNRSAPFWDFVASLEQEGTNHPFFSQFSQQQGENNERGEEGHPHPPPPPPPPGFGPWGWGFPGFGGRAFPHRGPPPPPFGPGHQEEQTGEKDNQDYEKEKEKDHEKNNDNGEGPSGSGSETEGCRRGRGRHGHCGSRRGRHGFGPGPHSRGDWGSHPWAHHRGPPHGHHGRRGGWRGGPFGGGPFNPLNYAAGLWDDSKKADANEDFSPDADIFDTTDAFVIHISLPGAKKEDVGVNWDVEKSELSIAGVIYRPGDEEFLKTLAMDERKVGPFERKIRLGTRANPAQIDADSISAKLEDGVLRVEVPKLGENGFVEVRKVDVE